MACSECAPYGVSYCPICSPEPQMVECPACGGKGRTYFAFNIERRTTTECTETAYNCLPEDEDVAASLNQNYCKGDIEVCEVCDGEGTVEYEPDYNRYDYDDE